MASFDIAFAWMMTSEDPLRAFKAVPDYPPGSFAISGINSAKFSEPFQRIAAIPQANREQAIRSFYRLMFWNRWFDQLVSDEVAKRVFDAAVNMGEETAVKLLQTAIGAVSGLTDRVDGQWGPVTLQRANACNPDQLQTAFRRQRCLYYTRIASRNPAEAKYLAGWLVRANK